MSVPSVSTTGITGDRWAVVITRNRGFETFEVGARTEAERLAAEIRGALADAYHTGVERGAR